MESWQIDDWYFFGKISYQGFVSVDISENFGEIITSSDPQMIPNATLWGSEERSKPLWHASLLVG